MPGIWSAKYCSVPYLRPLRKVVSICFIARRLLKVSKIVERYCKYYKFIYVNNEDVVFDKHLKDDGLHLDPDGRELLTNKFVNRM